MRVAIRAPSTLPDLGVGQRSFGAKPPKAGDEVAVDEVEVDEVEVDEVEVDEVSDSMVTEVDAGPQRPRIPPLLTAKRSPGKPKTGEGKPKFKLPSLPKRPPKK
ncbi:MAG: hypothetical protein R3A79_28620 [Nannocystaceae bacterium]